ncbi:hypothetical protein AB0L75_24270 [Streptomyces sp. NPDC052101]|uniref:hypothetical protein n=1 Tax=Streptomyces sp. NPDC052101 TaxID=3155763 RepID=UPI0034431345
MGVGALLIMGLRSYEAWVYPRSESWAAGGALIGGALVGLAAWAATDTEFSAVGWVMGLAFVVHCMGGTIQGKGLITGGLDTRTTLQEHPVTRVKAVDQTGGDQVAQPAAGHGR